MIIWRHEMRTGSLPLAGWSAAVALLMGVCVLIYPEMAGQMKQVSDIFAKMGSFSQAFGMDRMNFGEFIGFFGIECGNILGLGGALFAALMGIASLAKEERDHTAEFLLTHPRSRLRIMTEKLCAVLAQIVVLNAVAVIATILSVMAIGESVDIKIMALLFLAYFLMQVETALICFGVSAFLRRGGFGLGLGIAALFYFINLIANLTEQAKFLKYITPFGYTESSDIIMNGSLNGAYLAVGAVLGLGGAAAAFLKYCRKDIA